MRILACCLLALFPACSGSTDPLELTNEGLDALNRRDYPEAVQRLDAALAAIGDDPAHPQFLRAAVGEVQALAYVDPAKAVSELRALRERGVPLTDIHYNQVGSHLYSAGAYLEATDAMHMGLESFEDSAPLASLLAQIKKKSEEGGNDELTAKLKGLGYI